MIPVRIIETRYDMPDESEDDYCPDPRETDDNIVEYTFRDIIYLLRNEFVHPSASHSATPNTWATSESITDYGTAEIVETSIHLLRTHPRYEKYWVKAFRLAFYTGSV